MGRKKNREFWDSTFMNNRTYIHYYDRLTELAISMFEWKNLPDTVDARFMELALFSDGKAVFFKDEVLGFLCLRCATSGKWNVYNVPKDRRAYASNSYNMNLTEENSVIIYNNYLRKSCVPDIEMFAQRLYNIERTSDVNINAQKTPILIVCDESQKLTMENVYMQYQGNQPVIMGYKNLDIKGIQALKTDAPFVADKLQMQKFQIWNEAMTYLGISNVNMHKKERLLNDEVTRNMGSTVASRYSRLEMRKQACEQINKMFDLEIDVEYREDVQIIMDSATDVIDGDGEDGGGLDG